jgi:rRNA maturation RNase YbeY
LIRFFKEEIDFKLPQKAKIKIWLGKLAIEENSKLGEINYIFCSDEYLLKINEEYLDHDYYTDIITFDNTEEGSNLLEGEMYISIERIKENAINGDQTFERELNRVMAHGILHLAGYKDKTEDEQEQMRFKEEYYLNKWELENNQ